MIEYKLSELFELQMGKTPSRNNPAYWDSRDNAWISISDLSNAGKYIFNTKEALSDLAIDESGIKEIPPNTVIMSFKLSIGKVAITPVKMYSNEAIIAFIDKGVVELIPDYIYYLLLYKNWDVGTNKAVMGKTLNKATLSEITVCIHDIDVQNKIVFVLDKVKEIMSMRQKQLQDLDTLIKARFVEMFGDVATDNYKYETRKLGDVADVGSSHRVFTTEFVDSGIPFYRGTEIGELANGIKPTEPYYISEEHYNRLAKDDTKPQIGELQ